jgi:tetratricopeptide (TPR) repeat protein
VLTKTFYEKLALTDREGISLQESIGEIVYGMDVSREVDQAKHIPFLEPNSPELVAGGGISRGRAPRVVLTPMDQAELKLQKGDRAGAEQLAEAELKKDPSSGAALYMLARLKLMQGDPEGAFDRLSKVVATSKDPRTLAWSHIYLGRLYDSQQQPNRSKAVAEYRAALNIPGVQPDVQAAAAAGMQKPFAAPKRDAAPAPADDEELDPTGRKQKESYRPGEALPPPAR